MISIYKLKPKFQQLLRPILDRLHRLGVTANQITIAAILLSLLIGIAFWFANEVPYLFLALPIGLFLRMALNALDGMMARLYKQQSKLGEVLNELGDVVSDIFIYFPLLLHEVEQLYSIVIFLCLGVINEFAGLLAKIVGGERRYDGPMGKSDRAFLISVYGIVAFIGIDMSDFILWIFIGINVLLVLSTFLRLKRSLA